MLIHVESDDQYDQIIENELPNGKAIFVKCSASWCGPCKAIAPQYKELAKRNQNNTFITLDVDECENTVKTLKIRGMPTFVVLQNDKEVCRVVGADSKKLNSIVESYADQSSTETFEQYL